MILSTAIFFITDPSLACIIEGFPSLPPIALASISPTFVTIDLSAKTQSSAASSTSYHARSLSQLS